MRKVILGTSVMLLACWIVFPSMGISKPTFVDKLDKAPCATCHVKPMKGEENLNKVGKCVSEKIKKSSKDPTKEDLEACK